MDNHTAGMLRMNTQGQIENSISNLDLLRAIAVLIVYFSHLLMTFRIEKLRGIPIYELSQAGVMIFFVHTAFVLMLSLERQKESNLRSLLSVFYIRRAFRIYPLSCIAVFAVCIVSIPPSPWEPFQVSSLGTILANLTLTQNLIKAHQILNVLWSLPYEVQMYLALPFLFVAVLHRGRWVPFALWGASVALVLFVKIKGVGLLVYVPCFLGGVLAFRLWRSPRLRLPPFFWVVAIFIAVTLPLVFPLKPAAWCASLFLGIAIPQFREFRSPLVRWPSAFVAKYSYGIYLSHLPLFWFFLPGHPVLLALLSVLVPVAVYHLAEDPMVRLGKRLTSPTKMSPARLSRSTGVADVCLAPSPADL
jgi:peptidoglycan/LPS O-acetylase OafA/YrhL